MTTSPIFNFGRNLRLAPTAYYEPQNEQDVLAILTRHRGEQIRVTGCLHSWSEALGGEGVVLNLKNLQAIDLQSDGISVVVGAGCQIKMLLRHLKQLGKTLPSVGLIDEQTIAGAISTGTHGSGRHSLSHYVAAVRIARYDNTTGMAIIETIDQGEALQAAKCSLGCLGVILSVTMQCRDCYLIEEHVRQYATVDEVLKAQEQFPLQQFFLTPWQWLYLAQHRREVSGGRSRLAGLYRIYWHLSIDWGLHLILLATLRLFGSFRAIRFLYQQVIPRTVIHDWHVTDDSAAMLVMEHELFRHIEMELFVPRDRLPAALEYLKQVLIVVGQSSEIPAEMSLDPDEISQLTALKGQYGHHYPICIRRVMPDETLISMSSGGPQDWYAISLISYAKPDQREGFFRATEFLVRTMSNRFGVRPHWGKHCPLPPDELVKLYPQFVDFWSLCESRDPEGRFRNRWISRLFAASRGTSS